MKVRVAIIGFGYLGKWHTEKALSHPLADLVGIVDPSFEAREKAKKSYPDISVFETIEELSHLIDAAFVITPTSTHFDILQKLIEKGIHIFCEKPLTSSYKSSLEIKKIANASSLLIQVGHSERFHKIWDVIVGRGYACP